MSPYLSILLFFISSWGFACSTLISEGRSITGSDLATKKLVEWNPLKADKGTVVVFLSTKCPCSRSHEPVLRDLSFEYPGFKFIGIHSNQDEDLSTSEFYFQQVKLPFPVIQDKENALADSFRALKTPHVFVIGKAGECLYSGGVDDSRMAPKASKHYLKEALQNLQAGRALENKETRTLGCTILR